jgi:protein-tyrosine phosphatase
MPYGRYRQKSVKPGVPRAAAPRGRPTVALMEIVEIDEAVGAAQPGHEHCGPRCWRDVRAAPASRYDVRFRLLFVCTGNICRSPLAERLTRSILGPCPALQVISAGTRARAGTQMTERARRVLVRLGGDPDGFGSRPLTSELVAAADLVLTATSEHRAESVAAFPPAATRTFTIAEFGTLAGSVPPLAVICHEDPVRRAHTLIGEIRARRGLVRVDQPDIPDPYRGSRLAYRAAGRRIAKSLAVPLGLLTHSRVA